MFITNQSEDLTFRDFKKAEKSSANLKVDVLFLESISKPQAVLGGIVYLSYSTLGNLISSVEKSLVHDAVLIFDEFDSVAFSTAID